MAEYEEIVFSRLNIMTLIGPKKENCVLASEVCFQYWTYIFWAHKRKNKKKLGGYINESI